MAKAPKKEVAKSTAKAAAKPNAKAAVKPKATAKPKARKETLYSVHPGVAMVQKWIADLPAKTGKTLDQWIAYIRADGPPDEKGRRQWLKAVHGMGSNTASWLAERADPRAEMGMIEEDPEVYLANAEKYVDEQYAGPKAHLKAIYDRLLEIAFSLADDVKACPCKTIVPLYRNHVFAQLKPTTQKRIDLGFALKDHPVEGRLIDTGGFAKKDRITHRIPIESLDDIDGEVLKWLRAAYDLDSKK